MAATVNPQTDSRLMSLPRELRDMIYEYVFTPTYQEYSDDENDDENDEENDEEINRAERGYISLGGRSLVAAPPVNLALTCRLFHQECIDMHQSSYRAYWAENTFLLVEHDDRLTYDENAITPKHIQHMTHIVICIDVGTAYPNYLHLKHSKSNDNDQIPWTLAWDEYDSVRKRLRDWVRVSPIGLAAAGGSAKQVALDGILRELNYYLYIAWDAALDAGYIMARRR